MRPSFGEAAVPEGTGTERASACAMRDRRCRRTERDRSSWGTLSLGLGGEQGNVPGRQSRWYRHHFHALVAKSYAEPMSREAYFYCTEGRTGVKKILRCGSAAGWIGRWHRPRARSSVICSVQAEWCSVISTDVCARHRHPRQHGAQGLGRGAGASSSPRRTTPRPTSGSAARATCTCRRLSRPDARVQVALRLARLHPWAQQQAQAVGLQGPWASTPGPLGFGYNPELLAQARSCPCPRTWADLLKPEYKGDIQVANPASAARAYTMVATLVQLDGRGQGLRLPASALHRNVGQYTRSGIGPIKAVARGETGGVDQLRARRARARRCRASRSRPSRRASGTGAEIGSMSIMQGARNLEAAQEVLRMGAHAGRAGARRRQQAVPAAEPMAPPSSIRAFPISGRSVSSDYDYATVRRQRRAPPPDRALGEEVERACAAVELKPHLAWRTMA